MSKSPVRTRAVLAALVLALLATACSSASDVATGQDDTAAVTAEPVDEEVEDDPAFEVPDTAPAIEPGATALGSVEIDGVEIEYATSVPDGFEVGDAAPLLLAFPGGGQTISIAESMVAGTLSNEAQRLGWVVVSPAAPDGERFFDGSEVLVPGLLDWVDMWVDVEGDAPHVAGISNGGLSSFRYAALNPDRVQSVTAFPGFPRNSDDRAALTDFADVPIRLFVGGTDTNWIGPAEQTVTEFEELGGDVELTIFPGEGHIMDSTRDGTIVFEQLESFR